MMPLRQLLLTKSGHRSGRMVSLSPPTCHFHKLLSDRMCSTKENRLDMEEEPITATIDKMVNAGSLAGAVTLVWQDGKVIQTAGVGRRDREARLPMERNT